MSLPCRRTIARHCWPRSTSWPGPCRILSSPSAELKFISSAVATEGDPLMPAYPYGDKQPKIDSTAYLAPGARVVGDVELGPGASVWFNAGVRGDSPHVRIWA